MYRKMHSSEFFSRMQAKALERRGDVEERTGRTLLHENGLLFYGEDTGETVEGSVEGARRVMESLGLPHKFYATGDNIADAYPALGGCRGKPYSGVCEDTAGHISASKGEMRHGSCCVFIPKEDGWLVGLTVYSPFPRSLRSNGRGSW